MTNPTDAERRDWLQGYEFALRNLSDEAVQADLARVRAESGTHGSDGQSGQPRTVRESGAHKSTDTAPNGDQDRVTDSAATERELREALDDLWGCIAKPEIDQLQPETVRVAQENHERLWHSDEDLPWWAIWRRRLS